MTKWYCLLIGSNHSNDENSALIIVGLMILVAVAMLLTTVIAVSALACPRNTGQCSQQICTIFI